MVTTEKQTLDGLYSRRGRNVSPPRVGDPSKSASMISFIYGFPDPDSLPAASVADAAVKALEDKWQMGVAVRRNDGRQTAGGGADRKARGAIRGSWPSLKT